MADDDQRAVFKLLLPEDPANDNELHLELTFQRIKVHICWPDDQRDDLPRMFRTLGPLIQKSHLEYEVVREAAQIDSDLNALFPEGDE